MSYGPNVPGPVSARRHLRGQDSQGYEAADLPTKFELVINLKSAKALGQTMPPSLLGQAERVIE